MLATEARAVARHRGRQRLNEGPAKNMEYRQQRLVNTAAAFAGRQCALSPSAILADSEA